MLTYVYFEVKVLVTLSHYLKIWHSPIKYSWIYKANHWTINYRSQWHTFILRSSVWSYWLIIPNTDVPTSNSLQDKRQNHWTMKYRSQRPTFILRSNVGSYWLIISMYDVHTSNCLQNKRQSGLWNIGHSDLRLFCGQTSSHTDS